MIYHFILNPKSVRKPKDRNVETEIKKACKSRQLDYHIYYTTCPGDATEYVRSMVRISTEKQRFICVGGDGSISEIVNSAPCNPNVEFGVIPKGSGNDFIRNFTNKKLFSNIESQLDGDIISLDLIKCNDYYSANMINIGFDCEVVRETKKLRNHKFVSRKFMYILGVIIVFFRRWGTKMKLIFDNGDVVEKELTLTAIANGQFCGGGFRSAPTAQLNDGLMNLCSINKVSKFTFLSLVSKYKKGTYLASKRAQKIISYKQISHVKIEFSSPQPICIDGEIKGAKTVDLSVIPDGFKFVVPKGCTLIGAKENNSKKTTAGKC